MSQSFEELARENAELKKQCEQQNNEIQYLREQLANLKKVVFASRTEKTRELIPPDQLNLFDEAEQEANERIPEPAVAETTVKEHTRKKHSRNEKVAQLPHEKEVCDVPEEDKHCEIHPEAELVEIAEKFVRTEVRYIPAQIRVVDVYQKVYQCPECKKEGRFGLKKAEVPPSLLPHSLATPALAAQVLTQKYEMGVPFHRQEKAWKELSFPLTRTTMANWTMALSKYYLAPLMDHMRQRLLGEAVLHADETTVQVHREKGRKNNADSYMWVYCTSPLAAGPAIRVFEYRPGRRGEYAKEFLKGFHGTLVHDQYKGYNKVECVTHAGCWAHLRRKFVEAMVGQAASPESTAGQAVLRLKEIFAIESSLQELTAEERREKRLDQEKLLVEAFFSWLEKLKSTIVPKSKLGEAVIYALEGKKSYLTYLEDGNVSMTNAAAENAIRPFAVGRQNWLFSDSPKGASASAAFYSMIETCKANGISASKYLTYIFTKMPKEASLNSLETLESYMPWNELIQETCKAD